MNSGSSNRDAKIPPGALPIGAKLGKYEIVEHLGVGGQSIVYKGLDPLLDRPVAIKGEAPDVIQ